MVQNYPTNGNTKFGIVAFGTNARIILPLTDNRTQVLNALTTMTQAGTNTNLIAGMNTAKQMLDAYQSAGNEGLRSIVLITDGEPNVGGSLNDAVNVVNSVKHEGIFVYVAGFGAVSANPPFFQGIASTVDMCRIATSSTELQAILNDPVIGLNVQQNARRNEVEVTMGNHFEFIGIVSNSNGGSWALTGGSTGTLYWEARNSSGTFNTTSTLVYKVRLQDSALGLGFLPVSEFAALHFTVANSNGRAFHAGFDIPLARRVNEYTVTFDSDGGSAVPSQTLPEGNTGAVEPSDPVKDGYNFVGWYLGETLYDFTTPVTADITLRAYWEPALYNVTYRVVNGTWADGTTTDITVSVPFNIAPTSIPVGMLAGINYDQATGAWDLSPTTHIVTANIVFTYTFAERAIFTVSFDLAGGGPAIASQSVYEGHLAVRPTDPTRARFTFVDWYLGTSPYDFTTPVTADIELVARWTPVRFTVTFNPAGGSPVPSQSVEDGTTVTKPADPTRDGYTFVGWYLGNSPYDFASPVTTDLILIARWNQNPTPTVMPKTGDGLLLPLTAMTSLALGFVLLGRKSRRVRIGSAV